MRYFRTPGSVRGQSGNWLFFLDPTAHKTSHKRSRKGTKPLWECYVESKIDQPACIGWVCIAKRILISFFLFTVPLLIYPRNTEYGYTKIIFALVFISLILLIWA